MTTEEAISLIGNIQFDLTDGYYQREEYTEALCVFDRLNQENTKLKAEIEQLKLYATNIINAKNLSEETAVSIRIKMQREILLAREIELLREMYEKSKAEIERLNGKSEMYRDMAHSFCESNKKLKAEIEQWQSTNLQLCTDLTRVECENYQLKSELEQSVKLPCKVGDTIYETFDGKINDWVIERISDVVIELKEKEPFMDNRLISFISKSFGKFVFLTQEEAEQSLKGQV